MTEITQDEREWLDEVVHWGVEITKLLLEKDALNKDKDWDNITYNLYLKAPFHRKEGEVTWKHS